MSGEGGQGGKGGGMGRRRDPLDELPDVRDGLNRKERAVLVTLMELERELRGRRVPTAMLYGRVVERVDMSVEELQRILQRLGAGQKEGRRED